MEIGKIVNTHGVKGELKVMPLTDNIERFSDLKWAYIEKNEELRKFSVSNVKYLKNFIIIKFEGINDMNSAETYKDSYIKIDRANAVTLPENTYFICDLIGCRVFTETGVLLGVLKEVLKTGSNDVYAVYGDNKGEILIPALKSVVKEVLVEDGKIVVSLPKGLVDDEI